jgi:hypothetical protein
MYYGQGQERASGKVQEVWEYKRGEYTRGKK